MFLVSAHFHIICFCLCQHTRVGLYIVGTTETTIRSRPRRAPVACLREGTRFYIYAVSPVKFFRVFRIKLNTNYYLAKRQLTKKRQPETYLRLLNRMLPRVSALALATFPVSRKPTSVTARRACGGPIAARTGPIDARAGPRDGAYLYKTVQDVHATQFRTSAKSSIQD